MSQKPQNTPRPASPGALEPMFGTFCATAQFESLTPAPGSIWQRLHYACHYDPKVAGWIVSKIVRSFDEQAGNVRISVEQVEKGISFFQALRLLAATEKELSTRPEDYQLFTLAFTRHDFSHFIAFAEREGYVFDREGVPHARPAADILPPGDFNEADITRAEKHVKRAAQDFQQNNDLPATLGLMHKFFVASSRKPEDFDNAIADFRIVAILDRMADKIDLAARKLAAYCDKHLQPGNSGLVSEADDALATAGMSARQLKAYGIVTQDFEHFLMQARVACHCIHAIGIHGLIRTGPAHLQENLDRLDFAVATAMDHAKKLGLSEPQRESLRQAIATADAPTVPPAFSDFVGRYGRERAAFIAMPKKSPPQPPV